MKAVRVSSLCAVLVLLAFWLAGCSDNNGRPIEVGEGTGAQWTPDKDGKFLVVAVDNQFSSEIEFVAHGRPGIFKMQVEPGKKRYMVLKDSQYTTELRTRKDDAGKAEFLELEERVLGVRKIHLRAVTKAPGANAKSPDLKVPGAK
jgi:hypothetical protein